MMERPSHQHLHQELQEPLEEPLGCSRGLGLSSIAGMLPPWIGDAALVQVSRAALVAPRLGRCVRPALGGRGVKCS